MSIAAQRLDDLLREWEDRSLVARVISHLDLMVWGKPMKAEGPIVHASRFRSDLLNATRHPFDTNCYTFESTEQNANTTWLYGHHTLTPRLIWNWMGSSRRVYAMDAALQQELQHTSLVDLRLSDIIWPFPSFAVELAEPIPGQERLFQTLVLENEYRVDTGQYSLGLYLIDDALATPLLTPEERQRLRTLLHFEQRKRPREREIALLKPIKERLHDRRPPALMHIRPGEGDISLTQFARDLQGNDHAFIGEALHLILNFVLYLKTLPTTKSSEQHKATPGAPAPVGPRNVITDHLELFQVSYRGQRRAGTVDPRSLPTGVETDLAGSTPRKNVSPHYRAGYWKRAPGRGNDPTAPKLIHVGWTIVNEELLENGELPHGIERHYASQD